MMEPIVSVVCVAYNHEKYIRDCLDGVVMQKTTFPFEIIVHDDCSTDGTRDIIKEYEKKYTNIRGIYQKENQYSQGKDIFSDICKPIACGKYIALCECDDYWTDREKLQKQFDAMENHPELDMCACAAWEEMGDTKIRLQEIRPKKESCILTQREVILGGGRYLATASLFFRKDIFDSLMEYQKIINFDYTTQIRGALRGGIYYIDDNMVIYRRAVENSWTAVIETNYEKRRKHLDIEVRMLKQFDIDTGEAFHDVITERLKAYTPFEEQLNMHRYELLSELSNLSGEIYLWGLGARGEAIQRFCVDENVELLGVCDLKNDKVGEKTKYGFSIMNTEFVFNTASIILASNNIIYDDLIDKGFKGKVVNLQKYMSLGLFGKKI